MHKHRNTITVSSQSPAILRSESTLVGKGKTLPMGLALLCTSNPSCLQHVISIDSIIGIAEGNILPSKEEQRGKPENWLDTAPKSLSSNSFCSVAASGDQATSSWRVILLPPMQRLEGIAGVETSRSAKVSHGLREKVPDEKLAGWKNATIQRGTNGLVHRSPRSLVLRHSPTGVIHRPCSGHWHPHSLF